MFESIIVYSSLAFIMIGCGNLAMIKRHKKDEEYYLAFIIPILAFTFVFGCRYDVGIDYMHYLNGYLHGSERESEPVFRFITALMSDNGIHYAFYFSLWAFIEIVLIYYSLRKYMFLLPYLAFFMIFGTYFMPMMNVMRQQLAACVFMVAVLYIEEKKLVKYLLCVLIATIFHRSALLLLVAFPVLAWKSDWFKSIKFQLIVYFAVVIFSMYFADKLLEIIEEPFLLFTSVTGYDDTYRYSLLENEKFSRTQFGNNSGLGLYINLLLTLPIIFSSKKIKTFYHSTFFEIVYTLWFVSILGGHLFGNSIILYRPFVYVVNFRMVMYAFFAYYCVKHKSAVYSMFFYGFIVLHLAMFLNMISNGEINKSRFLFFWDI